MHHQDAWTSSLCTSATSSGQQSGEMVPEQYIYTLCQTLFACIRCSCCKTLNTHASVLLEVTTPKLYCSSCLTGGFRVQE